jgi:GT2 family glycosyltransferase
MRTPVREGPDRLPAVDVAIVCWNHGPWLAACLDSIASLHRPGFVLGDVVVVDNASCEPAAARLSGRDDVIVITNATNVGFAAACNQAAARGRSEYLLLLNPDTRLDTDALARAIAELENPDAASVGILGLRLVDCAGVTQRTCGRFPNLRTIANQTLGFARIKPARWPGIRLTEWAHDSTRDVDFACAAALLLRRELFEALGGFDTRLFLYLEDADLSLRARRLGWITRYCADAIVEHGHGWASGGFRAWRLAHAWRTLAAYARIHLSPADAAAVAAMVCLLAPVARVGQSLHERSWRPLVDAARAWLLLLKLMAAGVTSAEPQRRATPATPLPEAE